MRENRPSGSEGGAGSHPLFLPLSRFMASIHVRILEVFLPMNGFVRPRLRRLTSATTTT